MRAGPHRIARLALAAALLCFAVSPARAITISILNNDSPGEGFNDPTPAAPVGGNNGTTVGQQRLNCFQEAANIWSSLLPGPGIVQISAQFDPLDCTATSAVLGSAGPIWVNANFPNAPYTGHWFNGAEVNNLMGIDDDPSDPEIDATFNSNLGQAGCLTGVSFYYGFDGKEGANIDLLAVLLHEFGHGLGFLTVTDETSGQQCCGSTLHPAAWDKYLLDTNTGLHWDAETNGQRAASAINTGKLVWDGPSVTTWAPSFQGPKPKLHVNSPGGIAGDYLSGTASFGPAISTTPVSGNVVLVNDGVGTVTDGCEAPFTNAGAIAGKIALIDRGTCTFVTKVKNAQNAGAIGVIVVNDVAGTPPTGMSGNDPTITIPSVRISLADGNTIKANLGTGVNVTLVADATKLAGADAAGHMMVFTPNPVQPGSSVSHWDVSATPNLLMEPAINADLNSSGDPRRKVDLTYQLMGDIGWIPVSAGVPAGGGAAQVQLASVPNPAHGNATLHFDLASDEDVSLAVYDMSGRKVRALASGRFTAGTHDVAWDGLDAHGHPAAAGVYLALLKGSRTHVTQHIVLLN